MYNLNIFSLVNILEALIQVIPYPEQIKNIRIENKKLYFDWRKEKYLISDMVYIIDNNDCTIKNNNCILLEKLLKIQLLKIYHS
jgi:hypothetical protein